MALYKLVSTHSPKSYILGQLVGLADNDFARNHDSLNSIPKTGMMEGDLTSASSLLAFMPIDTQ